MTIKTKQMDFWSGEFGKEYTDRNPQNLEEWDQLYLTNYGIRKTDINQEFLGDLDKNIRILEVGCNIGLQLLGLQRMGFKNLFGIELQGYAVEKSKQVTNNINIIQGTGFDIPFKDNYFDLVYTSGVLIHISPADLPKVISEMIRCSNKYIYGFEYYEDNMSEIPYRGNQGYLWKGDYSSEFLKQDQNLKLINKCLYPYISNQEKGNKDVAYLLEKA